MHQSTTHSAAGFRVTKTDGKTIFHQVPIFAECARGDLTFGGDWIAGAVAQAKQQERDGYLPPLHTRHHEPATEQTDSVKAVGVFRIVEARPLSFKGTRITAIFADLIITDDYMAGEIEKMRYPYRSVEIFDPEGTPKINSLALLDHEAPYLELPMLFAGEIEDQRKNVGDESQNVASAISSSFSLNYASNPTDPMLWSTRCGKSAALLFKFPYEEQMQYTNNNPSVPTNFADDNGDDKKPEYMEDNGDDKKDENMEDAEAGLDIAAVCESIKSGDISIADMDSLLAAIQSQQSEPEAEEATEEDDAAPAPAPGAEIMKGGSAFAKNFARISGENEALKARLDARDESDSRLQDVSQAMKRLEGKPLGSDLESRLTKFHETSGGNAILFKEYVDTMASMAGTMPSSDNGESFSAHPTTPKSAMAFQALGGEAVDKATQFARQYDQMKGRMRASEESYVRVNMKHVGFELDETPTS